MKNSNTQENSFDKFARSFWHLKETFFHHIPETKGRISDFEIADSLLLSLVDVFDKFQEGRIEQHELEQMMIEGTEKGIQKWLKIHTAWAINKC
jgi:hypothetical protein